MKLSNIVTVLVFILALGNFISYRSCKNNKVKYEAEKLSKVNLSTKYDSILNQPPKVVQIKNIIVKDSLVYVDRWHEPIPPTAKTYRDSIINDSIDVRVFIQADNLYSLKYAYKPIYKYKETIVEKKIPYPVVEFKEKAVSQKGLYGAVGLGYGKYLSLKLDLLYLTKKENGYGVGYIRHGDTDILSASYYVKF